MTKGIFISVIAICSILLSCNQGTAIVITNSSSTDKTLRVTFPTSVQLLNRQDSLQAWDLSNTENDISTREKYRYSLKIPAIVDTSSKTLFFTLKSGHEVTAFGHLTQRSTIEKTFVVSDADTLEYERKGGCWTYIIR